MSKLSGTELVALNFRAIRCIDGILETTLGTPRMLARNKSKVYAASVEVITPKQNADKTTYNYKAAVTISAIIAA